jgi:hypothetical protein
MPFQMATDPYSAFINNAVDLCKKLIVNHFFNIKILFEKEKIWKQIINIYFSLKEKD